MNGQEPYIAGEKKPSDWVAFKRRLLEEGNEVLWQEAFREYFKKRVELRYLHPIKVLQENGTLSGEGFSIMAILCTLVEFMESTVQGLKFKIPRKNEKLNRYEYSKSRDIFVYFLYKRTPFSKHFDEPLAMEFYYKIRCGLLHEAQTKGKWKIKANSRNGMLVDKENKIVYRNNFERAIQEFIKDYGTKLVNDKDLQGAFLRKFDSLCE